MSPIEDFPEITEDFDVEPTDDDLTRADEEIDADADFFEEGHGTGTRGEKGFKFPKTPLLTAEQEKILARTIKIGGRRGEKAREELITSNLRLVLKVAHGYHRSGGASLDDLIQEGNLGLIKAVEGFRPELEWRFSTYAVWWIRQFMTRHIINSGNTIRQPVHVAQTGHKYFRAEETLSAKLGYTPSFQEVANFLSLGHKESRKLEKMIEKMGRTNVLCLEDLALPNKHGRSGGQNDGIHLLIRDTSPTPEETCINDSTKAYIQSLLSTLSVREKTILELRFGIGETDTCVLRELGDQFDVTRERIRQIEKSALKKLREHASEIAQNV